MDDTIYDSMYLHKSLALCVLGVGMVCVGMLYLAEAGAVQVMLTGGILGYWGAGRLHFYNRRGTTPRK